MKRIVYTAILISVLAAGVFLISRDKNASWSGVDKTVVEHYAEKAGRPASPPFINTERGDLLLFLFLVAGAVGGFIGGYCFHGLFPPLKTRAKDKKNV